MARDEWDNLGFQIEKAEDGKNEVVVAVDQKTKT